MIKRLFKARNLRRFRQRQRAMGFPKGSMRSSPLVTIANLLRDGEIKTGNHLARLWPSLLNRKNPWLGIQITLYIYCLPNLAIAAQRTAIDTVLQNVLDYLSSGPARIIGVLAIMGVGFTTLSLQRIPTKLGISICIGIALMLGAPGIFDMLGV